MITDYEKLSKDFTELLNSFTKFDLYCWLIKDWFRDKLHRIFR